MSDEATFEMVSGTDGSASYGLFLKKDGVVVAVRPIIEGVPGDKSVFVGMRIRAMSDPSLILAGDTPVTPTFWGDFFPAVPWQKQYRTHSSVMIGMEVNRTPFQPTAVLDAIVQTALSQRLVDWLVSHVAGGDADVFLHPNILMRNFFISHYTQICQNTDLHITNNDNLVVTELEDYDEFLKTHLDKMNLSAARNVGLSLGNPSNEDDNGDNGSTYH